MRRSGRRRQLRGGVVWEGVSSMRSGVGVGGGSVEEEE
jgi:hypothetical protein